MAGHVRARMRFRQGLQTRVHPPSLMGQTSGAGVPLVQRVCTSLYMTCPVRTHVRVVLQVCAVFATPVAAQIAALLVSNNNYRLVEDLVK